jgi:hypothetical protein
MRTRTREIILHPFFVGARDGLKLALKEPICGQLIFVVGLSGSGKSEIRYECMRGFAGPPQNWSLGQLPAISVRAAPTDRSTFNPKEFMGRLYLGLHDPDISWSADRSCVDTPDETHRREESLLRSELWLAESAKRPEHKLREYVEKTAKARCVRAIFIEEGASLTYTQRQKPPGDHMVNYMCLAEELNVTIVLFGVPRMASLWEGNSEILRRSRFVYVDRYQFNKLTDRKIFERLAVSIARRYRFARSDLARRTLDWAYACSAGTFGELDSYYRRADDFRASDGRDGITKKDLERAILSEASLRTLHRDAAMFDFLRAPASPSVIERVLGA